LDYPLSDPYWCSHTLVKYEHWSKSPIVNHPETDTSTNRD